MSTTFRPETKKELKCLIDKLIEERGLNADLNDIDTSLITDMNHLFAYSEFNGDISKWDTSNVIKMAAMFAESKFNGDISGWDVSNVKDMYCMFAYSEFNRDLSKWNVCRENTIVGGDIVSRACYLVEMFKCCPLEGNEPEWYKRNVKDNRIKGIWKI